MTASKCCCRLMPSDMQSVATRTFRPSALPSASTLASLASQFAGVAALAGINLTASGSRTAEAVATLESRAFTENFIRERNLIPVLFADDWDAAAKRWRVEAEEVPTLGRAFQRFDSIREIEQRILKAEKDNARIDPKMDKPYGIPADFSEHFRLMTDMLTIAFQADLTRVATFLVTREGTSRAYREIGIADGHHPLTHHRNVVEMMEAMNRRIELLYDREHTLGHSFFLRLVEDPSIECLAQIFEKNILPLLQEYFFEDWTKIRQVLGDDQKNDSTLCFVTEAYSDAEIRDALGADASGQQGARAFKRSRLAPRDPDAYRLIYERDEA